MTQSKIFIKKDPTYVPQTKINRKQRLKRLKEKKAASQSEKSSFYNLGKFLLITSIVFCFGGFGFGFGLRSGDKLPFTFNANNNEQSVKINN